jgi:hypothetical protein
MFGSSKRKRQLKKIKQERGALTQQRAAWEAEQGSPEKIKAQSEQEIAASGAARRKAEEEGRAGAETFFQKDVQGLSPEQKSAMQYEASRQVRRGVQGASRALMGEQGRHGILGKSGVAYAQQRDLQKMGQEALGQRQRDIQQMNADLAMKKLAAIYAGGKGEAAQSVLERQAAQDRAEYEAERRRQRPYAERINELFFNRL